MPRERDLVSRLVEAEHVGDGDTGAAGAGGLAVPETQSQADVEAGAHPRIKRAVAKLGLTQRESQIVVEFAIGKSTQALASDLYISAATVRTHLRKIFTKLNICSRVVLRSTVIATILDEMDD